MTTSPESSDGASPRTSTRGSPRAPAAYRAALTCIAVVVATVSVIVEPLQRGQYVALLVLLGLGAFSAATLDDSTEGGVNYSFTSFVLTSSFPLVGPTGAVIIGMVIPVVENRYRWTPTHLFNTALIVTIAGVGGLTYRLAFGWLPVPTSGTPGDFLLHVGLPLLVADIVVLFLNAMLVAIMIKFDGGQFQYVLAGAIRQTAPLYLGYTALAFLFVMLWMPGELYELSVVLIMAPLLLARWSYTQYGDEFRAHGRIIETLVTAGDGWDHGGTGHGKRIDQYARLMVDELGLSFTEQRDLHYASALHDIGRLGTPRPVLEKPMELRDARDREVIAWHPILAEEIVSGIEFLADTARAIRHHHERPDGLGYPDGLVGDQIPLVSRVVAVADAYDALTSGAGPLPALDPDEAIEEMRRRAGTQLDRECVEAMARVRGRTKDIIERARVAHDDGPWRDHDDPRCADLMIGSRPNLRMGYRVEPS